MKGRSGRALVRRALPGSLRTVAATAAVAAAAITGANASPAATSSGVLPLHVLLTVSSELATVSRNTLIREAERIWRHEQVHIEWAPPGHTVEHPDAPLRVLVVTRPQAGRAAGEWPVAELLPEAVPRPLAIASIDSAERVVDEAARTPSYDARAPREYRLGLVLGRAVAHEIGHFLLATRTHADSGLMRATVDVREFAAVSGEPFRLDRDASQWLRERLAYSAAVAALRDGSFRYGRSPTPNPQLPISNMSALEVGSW
jgi:hypothetical protein